MRYFLPLFIIVLMFSFLPATQVCASTITLWDSGLRSTNGGPFDVRTADGKTSLFLTFCLEASEYINLSTTSKLYPFTVDAVSYQARYNGGAGPDPISKGTSFLYYHFMMHDLSTFEPGFGETNLSSLGDLQKAIWYLEGETGGIQNYLVQLVVAEYGSLSNAMADVNGGPVMVMNLLYPDGRQAQDQLVLVPEPGTLILLGTGLAVFGLGAARRRKSTL